MYLLYVLYKNVYTKISVQLRFLGVSIINSAITSVVSRSESDSVSILLLLVEIVLVVGVVELISDFSLVVLCRGRELVVYMYLFVERLCLFTNKDSFSDLYSFLQFRKGS